MAGRWLCGNGCGHVVVKTDGGRFVHRAEDRRGGERFWFYCITGQKRPRRGVPAVLTVACPGRGLEAGVVVARCVIPLGVLGDLAVGPGRAALRGAR